MLGEQEENMNAQGGRKVLNVTKPLAYFIPLLKRIQVHSHKYTKAVFKFIQPIKDKKRVNKKHIYNVLIITELMMGLLWPIYIINFVDKTDHFVIPGTDT